MTRSNLKRGHNGEMSNWEETSYPVPVRALMVSCLSCGLIIAGGRRGTRNIRSILKEIRAHDDAEHRPYDPGVIQAVTTAVQELNGGALPPRRVGRLAVDLAGSGSAVAWRRKAEVLERHVAVLVEERGQLVAAIDRLRYDRDVASADRERLQAQLAEALKEIDVLQGVRDALRAELVKAQPNRRTTGLLAEVSKAAAAALVASCVAVGAHWVSGLEDAETKATTVVSHANVVIAECELGIGSSSP